VLDWQAELAPGLKVDIDPHDLMELVGVVLENAAKWGRTSVVVTGRANEGTAELRVADDGPGLTEDQIGHLGVRGQRHDESRRGSGLGLAIALEVVALNAGTMHFARAGEGGLEVVVRLPLA
jgi:signal transduction histidine kinase